MAKLAFQKSSCDMFFNLDLNSVRNCYRNSYNQNIRWYRAGMGGVTGGGFANRVSDWRKTGLFQTQGKNYNWSQVNRFLKKKSYFYPCRWYIGFDVRRKSRILNCSKFAFGCLGIFFSLERSNFWLCIFSSEVDKWPQSFEILWEKLLLFFFTFRMFLANLLVLKVVFWTFQTMQIACIKKFEVNESYNKKIYGMLIM